MKRLRPFAVIMLAFVFAGCGGGGSGGASPAVSKSVRSATFSAVKAQFATLPHTDPIADGKAMAAFLASRKEFEASGTSPDGSAWGRFTDGRLFLVLENRG